MPDWDDVFAKKGKYFTTPHPDMERLANLFDEKGVRRILDLGCGTGRHLLFLLNKGFDVYGLDGAPNGLEIAKNWLTCRINVLKGNFEVDIYNSKDIRWGKLFFLSFILF